MASLRRIMHIDEHAYPRKVGALPHTHAPLVNSGESGGGSLRSGYFIPFPSPSPHCMQGFLPAANPTGHRKVRVVVVVVAVVVVVL